MRQEQKVPKTIRTKQETITDAPRKKTMSNETAPEKNKSSCRPEEGTLCTHFCPRSVTKPSIRGAIEECPSLIRSIWSIYIKMWSVHTFPDMQSCLDHALWCDIASVLNCYLLIFYKLRFTNRIHIIAIYNLCNDSIVLYITLIRWIQHSL